VAEITAEGVYDIPEDEYHADPVVGGSLSSTTARRLLAPSCPALARWEADNPEHKTAYDLGTVAHKLVLGKGGQFVEVKAKDWRTKAAQEQQDAARAAGLVPLLSHQLRAAERMADAVLSSRFAAIFQDGAPEQVYVWRDRETGQWCRAMLDWAPNPARAWALIVGDLKTSANPSPHGFAKSCAEYGYHIQQPHYLDGFCTVHQIDPHEVDFWFVVVGKEPPHLVQAYRLDDTARAAGQRLRRHALDVWARCRDTGEWPSWSDDVHTLTLPRWATT
jgi:hypothetical protein